MLRDGVTSAFEWRSAQQTSQGVRGACKRPDRESRSERRSLKRACACSAIQYSILPAGIGGTALQLKRSWLRGVAAAQGIAEGAVAVGFGSAYTPGARMAEIERMFRVASEGDASVHIHMRNNVAGLDSTIAAAASAKAKLHIVHVNSSGDTNLVAFLDHIQAARDKGQDVTTEAYPYGAGMTEIHRHFDNWSRGPKRSLCSAHSYPPASA